MRTLRAALAAVLLAACLTALCGASPARPDIQQPTGETLVLAPAAEGWKDGYLSFLDDCFDIFSALWPDGVSGFGFIDLDLDGTPELVVFDQGTSAAMGAHLFDLKDGWVYCVSSTLDSAAGAFDSTYLSPVDVCTNLFESFRLSRTADGWCFWVDSSNGTMETTWDEFVRFGCADGLLTPETVCYRYLEYDPASGLVADEQYNVAGEPADAAAYEAAADVYWNADVGYEPKGAFRWSELNDWDTTTYDGFMALARAAADAYVPITDTVPQAVVGP